MVSTPDGQLISLGALPPVHLLPSQAAVGALLVGLQGATGRNAAIRI